MSYRLAVQRVLCHQPQKILISTPILTEEPDYQGTGSSDTSGSSSSSDNEFYSHPDTKTSERQYPPSTVLDNSTDSDDGITSSNGSTVKTKVFSPLDKPAIVLDLDQTITRSHVFFNLWLMKIILLIEHNLQAEEKAQHRRSIELFLNRPLTPEKVKEIFSADAIENKWRPFVFEHYDTIYEQLKIENIYNQTQPQNANDVINRLKNFWQLRNDAGWLTDIILKEHQAGNTILVATKNKHQTFIEAFLKEFLGDQWDKLIDNVKTGMTINFAKPLFIYHWFESQGIDLNIDNGWELVVFVDDDIDEVNRAKANQISHTVHAEMGDDIAFQQNLIQQLNAVKAIIQQRQQTKNSQQPPSQPTSESSPIRPSQSDTSKPPSYQATRYLRMTYGEVDEMLEGDDCCSGIIHICRLS